MNICKLRFRYFLSRQSNLLRLTLIWLLGLALGITIAYCNPHLLLGFDCIALLSKPTIIYMLAANLIPIIFLYYTLSRSLHLLCYLFVFLNSISVACFGIGLHSLFKDGTWLVRLFLMFSHSFSTVFSWTLLFRYTKDSQIYLRKDLYISLISISVITVLDYFFITPVVSEIYTIF